MRPRLREAELRAPVAGLLEARGYRVWADPDGRDFLDMVAVRGEEIGLVELKVADWRTVRAQAIARRALADWVAVALPSARAAGRLIGSRRGPVAPRVGVLVVEGLEARELRPAVPLDPPTPGTPAAAARERFRALVRSVIADPVPFGISWGGAARRTGGGRGYRLEEFVAPEAAAATRATNSEATRSGA